jgi:exopolyphosphatase/guanosine-5'-triphosphate,3'-diphosphate pyrophosphatase
VTEQIGREPTVEFEVVARCASGHPLVIRNHPFDRTGEPFPTRYWLTCPQAAKAVSRLESDGWIRRLNERADQDPDGFGAALRAAHAAYAADRAEAGPEARDHGGVGGTRTGLKCLHAHYAFHLAGGGDPAGAWVAERVEPVHGDETPGRVAAVDLGTNTIRLLVAQPAEGGFAELARDTVITRIGEGVDRTGRIDPAALSRTLAVLDRYARRARALRAEEVAVSATSAVRDAENREDLEHEVERLTGSVLRVITGDQEADLTFAGATRGLDADTPFLVLDIGGGSTELVVGGDQPDARISTQIGSVRLTERHLHHDPPLDDEIDALEDDLGSALGEAAVRVRPERARTLVAVAGTATTVQAIALGLDGYDPEAIHRSRLARDQAEEVLERLAAMTTAERAAMPVMVKGREDVIVAGAAILVEVMDRFGFDEAVVSEADILDGLVLEQLGLV